MLTVQLSCIQYVATLSTISKITTSMEELIPPYSCVFHWQLSSSVAHTHPYCSHRREKTIQRAWSWQREGEKWQKERLWQAGGGDVRERVGCPC